MTSAHLVLLVAGAAVSLWMLAKVGHALTKLLEGAAAIAVVFLTAWLTVKGLWRAGRWTVRHWRTSLATAAVLAWWHWLGLVSWLVAVALTAVGLLAWRRADRTSFEAWAGRHLRAWWQRWTRYAPRMPGWLRACGLTVPDHDPGITVQVNPFRRTAVRPKPRSRRDQLPHIVRVRSGGSWDEVHVKLVPGQTPEDFDQAARALAVARGVTRCQVRELAPNVVSIDYQRRDLLTDVITCRELAAVAGIDGASIDLRRVWSGRTEYGTDWHQSLQGGHTLIAGSTGAGKNSHSWAPIVSIAPAIRDGLVRVSGIDPKGMELAYGRRLFYRYAVTSKDALALLDDLVGGWRRAKLRSPAASASSRCRVSIRWSCWSSMRSAPCCAMSATERPARPSSIASRC